MDNQNLININDIEERYYLIQLHGANHESQLSKAKVSINKIDHINNFKWYLGKDRYPFTYIKGGKSQLYRYI